MGEFKESATTAETRTFIEQYDSSARALYTLVHYQILNLM